MLSEHALKRDFLFSSESVTEGHPDKIADQISDSVLDALLKEDPNSRVACETLVTTGLAMIAGEITTNAYVHLPEVVRGTLQKIGYDNSTMGFDYQTCAVTSSIDRQSPDISQGVTAGEGLYKEQGAGDQGIMFGYACTETDQLMPAPIHWAHRLTERLASARKSGELPFLRPDGKSQVTMEYRGGKPKRMTTIVISSQHTEDIPHESLTEGIREEVVKKVIPSEYIDSETRFLINPTGRFVLGGPQADCGLTGRKVIVDTYGGAAPHGGGAFSGKDPTKVDRSATYMARYIAKNVVASGASERCLVQLAYAIGVAEPVSVFVDCGGSAKVAENEIETAIRELFKLRPGEIIEQLHLKQPIYTKTAAYGHFGRDQFPWEQTDKADELKRVLKL